MASKKSQPWSAGIRARGASGQCHNPSWLLAQCDNDHKHILDLKDEHDRRIPLFVHKGRLSFSVGELTVGHLATLRHVLVGNFNGISINQWFDAIQTICQTMSKRSVLFFLGVVHGEELDSALLSSEVQRRYLILQQGPVYQRRFCNIQTSLEEYLLSLPAKSRQDLKRSLRRFSTEYQDRFSVTVSSSIPEVTAFLDIVEPVSRETYQGKLLGLAVGKDGHIGHEAIEGARLGYTRCLLLTIDDKPVAWRIGFIYGNNFYSHNIGFAPEFRRFHPGVVMHLQTIMYLSEHHPEIEILDMLYGDNDFKRKVATSSRQERNVYLFQRNLYGWCAWSLLKSSNFVSELTGRALEKLGLKAALKSAIRRIKVS